MTNYLSASGIDIYKGEHKTFLLTVLDADRNPVDLAGSEITFTLRPEICDDKIILTKSSLSPAQIEILEPSSNGQAYVHFVPSDTSDLKHGIYAFDVWIKLITNKQMVVIEPSPFEIKLPVTQDLVETPEPDEGGGVDYTDIVTNAEMNLYVRTDGDDDNLGTETSPLLTIAEAERRIPYIIVHPVIIHLGDSPVGGWDVPAIKPRILRKPFIIIGDGAGVGDGFTELLNASAEAGSTQYQVVSTGLTPNAYRGKTIIITSGAAIGDRRSINDNDASNIYPDTPFTAAVAAADTFRIVEPAIDVLLNTDFAEEKTPHVVGCGNQDGYVTASSNSHKVWFVNVRFSYNVMSPIMFVDSSIIMYGVEFDNTWANLMYLKNSQVLSGRESEVFTDQRGGSQTAMDLFDAPNYLSWDGWGISCLGPFAVTDNGWFKGTLVAQQLAVTFSDVTLYGGNIYQWGIFVGPHSGFGMCHINPYYPNTPLLVTSDFDSAIVALEEGRISIIGNNALTIATIKHGLEARDGGLIIISGQINGNADQYGHWIEFNGKIDIHDGLPTLTGTLGDITPDRGVNSYANSTLVAGSAYVDAIHGRIQRGYH